MSITAAEFERKLDEFIIKAGGTKEIVTYQITPSRMFRGMQMHDCKEISSRDVTAEIMRPVSVKADHTPGS